MPSVLDRHADQVSALGHPLRLRINLYAPELTEIRALTNYLWEDCWSLEDPKGKPVERVREIRDDVRDRVARLLREQGWAKV